MILSPQISMEGVRALAKALEQNASRGISDVYVHNEGRIDALGRKGGASAKVTMARMTSASRPLLSLLLLAKLLRPNSKLL